MREGCRWAPDFTFLSLLSPQHGKVLEVSLPQQVIVQDSANQTQNASTISQVSFAATNILAACFPTLLNNQAVLFESLRAGMTCTDNSGKLAILTAVMIHNDSIFTGIPAIFSGNTLPWTAPAFNGAALWLQALTPIPLLIPRPAVGVCPSATFLVQNTDGASSHTFKRAWVMSYRIISNIDFSVGPALPGSGIGL